jgi:hypothetical protein
MNFHLCIPIGFQIANKKTRRRLQGCHGGRAKFAESLRASPFNKVYCIIEFDWQDPDLDLHRCVKPNPDPRKSDADPQH